MVLPCYEDKPSSMEGLKVEWRKKDLKDLVHLYKDGESRAEEQDEDYQDRANLFTDEIQHGNFSLHLDKLRAEDAGEYTCTRTVLIGPASHHFHGFRRAIQNYRQFSTNTNLVLKLLGKSTDKKKTYSSILNQ